MSHDKRVEIRWRDCDAYGHVNNAVYATYLEECRDEWAELVLGADGDLWGFVLARFMFAFTLGNSGLMMATLAERLTDYEMRLQVNKNLLAKYEYDYTKLLAGAATDTSAQDTLKELSSPAVQTANKNLTSYLTEHCGGSATTTSST